MVDSFDVLYSLDGLLVLNQRRGLFIVCNPIIRQWTNLPAQPRWLRSRVSPLSRAGFTSMARPASTASCAMA